MPKNVVFSDILFIAILAGGYRERVRYGKSSTETLEVNT